MDGHTHISRASFLHMLAQLMPACTSLPWQWYDLTNHNKLRVNQLFAPIYFTQTRTHISQLMPRGISLPGNIYIIF